MATPRTRAQEEEDQTDTHSSWTPRRLIEINPDWVGGVRSRRRARLYRIIRVVLAGLGNSSGQCGFSTQCFTKLTFLAHSTVWGLIGWSYLSCIAGGRRGDDARALRKTIM